LNEEAATSVPGYVEAGETALHSGDVRRANDEYQLAARAMDRLGRNDTEASQIRQKAVELNAINNLSTVSLYDICEAAHQKLAEGSEKWAANFDKLYRGSWIVIEANIVRDEGADGARQWVIKYPFAIDDTPVLIDARLKALDQLTQSDQRKKVIFAGQLASFKKEGTKSPAWVIRFTDATAFLWADFDTYQALGFGADEFGAESDVPGVLKEQAAVLGVKR